MIRTLPVLSAFALVLFSGLVHGLWTARWHTSRELDEAVARVPHVPLTCGNWKGQNLEVDAEEFAHAGALGYWLRRYQNKDQGSVSVILMCGPAGRMSVHTPDICYRGAGFEVVSDPAPLAVQLPGTAEPARLWTARFAREQAVSGSQLRLCWSWGAGGTWQAPERPRFHFASEPALYKLYVIHELTLPDEPARADPTVPFLQQFLPELNKALFASSEPGNGKL